MRRAPRLRLTAFVGAAVLFASATAEAQAVPEADLSITKTDGVSAVLAGGNVTYTIVASNAGPSDTTGTVVDTFPTSLTCTWTCAGGCTPSGTGNINDNVTLLAGSSVTYVATCAVSSSATGTLVNTATISGQLGDPDTANNTATDRDVIVTAAPTPTSTPTPTPTPTALVITGAGEGGGPHVRTFTNRAPAASFFAFAPGFLGGVRVAGGDVNGDGIPDIITGTGPGAQPRVRVFDASGNRLGGFLAYASELSGGVFVAGGDVNGDGFADVITGSGAGAGGGPGAPGGHVKVFDGRTGAEVRSFFAFAPGFLGGVQVGAGDVNGDGRDDIIVGSGPAAGASSGPSHVKVFSGVTNEELMSFFPYGGFSGGVFVAAGDVDGDGRADVITGAGPSGGPHVKAFSGVTGAEVRSFFAFAPGFLGGVRVGAGDVNGDGIDEIITGKGPGTRPNVRVFDGATGRKLVGFLAYDPAFQGGVFVAGSN